MSVQSPSVEIQASDVFHGEEGLVFRPALADETDGSRGDRDHACRGEEMSATTSADGPRLSTWALQQVGGYLGYTGRDANIVRVAALDPEATSRAHCHCFTR